RWGRAPTGVGPPEEEAGVWSASGRYRFGMDENADVGGVVDRRHGVLVRLLAGGERVAGDVAAPMLSLDSPRFVIHLGRQHSGVIRRARRRLQQTLQAIGVGNTVVVLNPHPVSTLGDRGRYSGRKPPGGPRIGVDPDISHGEWV